VGAGSPATLGLGGRLMNWMKNGNGPPIPRGPNLLQRLGASGAAGLQNVTNALPKTMSALSSVGKVLGKVAAPLAVGLTGMSIYQHATDETASRAEKKAAISGDVGGLGGMFAGGAAGAAIGSVVPVVGTIIGGLVGGALGAWGGAEIGTALGTDTTPTPPTTNGVGVNTASDPLSTTQTDASGKPIAGATTADGKAVPDSAAMLAQALNQVNTTLGNILEAINTTSTGMADNSSATLEIQKRIQRFLKSGSISGDNAPASSAYNVG
jgi:phage tail tape-measure protein